MPIEGGSFSTHTRTCLVSKYRSNNKHVTKIGKMRRRGGTNGDVSSPDTSPKTDELMKKKPKRERVKRYAVTASWVRNGSEEGACEKVRCDGLF
jgi:hypothetical protein